MMTLLQAQDELSRVRSLIYCATMACQDLSSKEGDALDAVLSHATDKLEAISDAIEVIRTGPCEP